MSLLIKFCVSLMLLKLSSSNRQTKTNMFNYMRSVQLSILSENYLIRELKAQEQLSCVAACSSDDNCASCTFDANHKCSLYNNSIITDFTGSSNEISIDLFLKIIQVASVVQSTTNSFSPTLSSQRSSTSSSSSLTTITSTTLTTSTSKTMMTSISSTSSPMVLRLILNTTRKIVITNSTFKILNDFDYSKTTDLFYVSDDSAKAIIVFDKNFTYLFRYNMSAAPTFIRAIDDYIYVSESIITRYKINPNALTSDYKSSITGIRGIDYDETRQVLLGVEYGGSDRVCSYSKLLNTNKCTSLSISPYSVVIHNDVLYVGCVGSILLIDAKNITKILGQYNIIFCLGRVIYPVVFDNNGYMIVYCGTSVPELYLYYEDGSFTGNIIATTFSPRSVKFDSMGRMIVVSSSAIEIFY